MTDDVNPQFKGLYPSYWDFGQTSGQTSRINYEGMPKCFAGNFPETRCGWDDEPLRIDRDEVQDVIDPTGAQPDGAEPGEWTPVEFAVVPRNLDAANALGLSLGDAWDTQYDHVLLGDGSMCYWNGTAFVAGQVGP